MVYTLKITGAYCNGKNVISNFRPIRRTYSTLDKARAAARRQVWIANGFYECGVYNDSRLVGWVISDSDYAYGGYSGVFWVPKGQDHEGYLASGVSATGELTRAKYRLT